jgi:diaminopimelate decarboxylase
LRHRLPGSAARIISQNFASCRLASSFKVTFLLTFTLSTSFPYELAWVKMGCGIPIGYHFCSNDAIPKITQTINKVNEVNTVFCLEKNSI